MSSSTCTACSSPRSTSNLRNTKIIDRRGFVAGSLAACATPAWARPHDRALAARIDAAAPPAFSGAAIYARGGRLDYERYNGLADLERRIPNGPNTRFAFGSGSKWLTTVAVLRLVDTGTLSLDATVADLLPKTRHDTGEQVKLAHLLSNTSGIPDLLTRALNDQPSLRTSRDSAAAMVARFGGGDLTFQPGTGFDYTVLNWVMVLAIVERVTGKPFAAAMRELVFDPLSLPSLALANHGWAAISGMARGYSAATPPVLKMGDVGAFAAASGNMVGTPADAVRAIRSVFAGGFLSPASRAELLKLRWPEQEYALGGRVHAVGAQRWAWEVGKVQGYRALVAQNLGRDETIVLFNNTDMAQPALSDWAERIAQLAA